MDPLSIATAAAGLAKFTINASESLYACIDAVKSVDPTLLQLQSEVDALHSGLENIASTFQSRELVELLSSDQDHESQSAKLLTSIRPLLSDCKTTLQHLIEILGIIRAKSMWGRGFLRRPVKALKLNTKSSEIVLIRHQLRSYSSAMQMTLQMVNV